MQRCDQHVGAALISLLLGSDKGDKEIAWHLPSALFWCIPRSTAAARARNPSCPRQKLHNQTISCIFRVSGTPIALPVGSPPARDGPIAKPPRSQLRSQPHFQPPGGTPGETSPSVLKGGQRTSRLPAPVGRTAHPVLQSRRRCSPCPRRSRRRPGRTPARPAPPLLVEARGFPAVRRCGPPRSWGCAHCGWRWRSRPQAAATAAVAGLAAGRRAWQRSHPPPAALTKALWRRQHRRASASARQAVAAQPRPPGCRAAAAAGFQLGCPHPSRPLQVVPHLQRGRNSRRSGGSKRVVPRCRKPHAQPPPSGGGGVCNRHSPPTEAGPALHPAADLGCVLGCEQQRLAVSGRPTPSGALAGAVGRARPGPPGGGFAHRVLLMAERSALAAAAACMALS